MKRTVSSSYFLYFLALVKIIIPYFLQSSFYEPHRDEMLYLAEGHHMAWGFMEVPPLLSVFAWLTHLLGDGMFWIKLWPSLLGAATFVIAGKIVQSLGGGKWAIFLLFLPFVFGVYLRLFFLFQPNPPEIFFWTLMAGALIRFVQTGKNKWLYVFGISAGLGLMSKYSAMFFIMSLLAGLLLTPHRKVFLNKHFWIASFIGLLIFLPNIIWQFRHGLPVAHHMKMLNEYQLQYVSHKSFLIDQLLMNLPCVFIWLAGLFFLLLNAEGKKYRFIGFAFLFEIILLLVFHGKNYYSLGLYPVMFVFGAYFIERATVKRFKAIRYALVVFAAIFGVLMIPMMLPIFEPGKLAAYYQKTGAAKTGVLKWEDMKDHPLPQDFSDMLGWNEMAQKVAKAYNILDDSSKKEVFIFCNNYGMAGAVNFFGKHYHLPEAYSDEASFLNWIPSDKYISDMILVTDDPHEEQHDFAKGFISVTRIDSITNEYARERGDYIYLFRGADDNFRRFFKEKIEKDKAAFK